MCGKVYVPSRGSCPTDGVPTTEDVELANVGTITTYCVVNVPFAGQSIEIPYICAQVLLDGANLSFMGLIQEIPTDQIRMGMRVEAVWVEPEELTPSLASVKYFRPNGRARRRLRDVQGVPVSAAGPHRPGRSRWPRSPSTQTCAATRSTTRSRCSCR